MGVPSFITVETEDGSWIGEKDAQKTEKDDVKVTYETTPETEEIWLTADQTKVKTIKLRWNTPVNKKITDPRRILGENVRGCGLERYQRQSFYALVFSGSSRRNCDRVWSKGKTFRHVFLAGRYPWNHAGDGCTLWRYGCDTFREKTPGSTDRGDADGRDEHL